MKIEVIDDNTVSLDGVKYVRERGVEELEILAEVHQWLDSDADAYNRFWTYLSERLRSRDPYYRDTQNQYELYYLGLYELGDFTATKEEVKSE